MLAYGLDKIARSLHLDLFVGRPKMTQIEGQQMGAALTQSRDEYRQVLRIGLPAKVGEIRGLGIGHDSETAADDQTEFRKLGGQLFSEITLDLYDRLLGSEAVEQCDFAHLQHDVTGAVFGSSCGAGKDDIRVQKYAKFFGHPGGCIFL